MVLRHAAACATALGTEARALAKAICPVLCSTKSSDLANSDASHFSSVSFARSPKACFHNVAIIDQAAIKNGEHLPPHQHLFFPRLWAMAL